MNTTLKSLMIIGGLACALPLFAQTGDGSGTMDGNGPMGDGWGYMGGHVELPQELIDLREDVIALRDQLFVSRAEALATLSDDATLEERRAVLDAWRAENEALLADLEMLTEEMRLAMEEFRPDGPMFPGRPPIPDEVKQSREQLVAQRQALRESRQAVLDGLPEDATEEEIRAALEEWRIANEAEIRGARELAQQIRNWFHENRPPRPQRPDDAPELVQARHEMRAQAMELRQARVELRERLRNASEDEREQILQEFREQQRELMRAHKDLKRQERLNDGATGGDRRPGQGG